MPGCNPASAWWSTASTACARARRSKRRKDRFLTKKNSKKEDAAKKGLSEPLPAVHPAAGGDLAADGRDPDLRHPRLPPAAAVRPARGRLPHHPGADVLPGREP